MRKNRIPVRLLAALLLAAGACRHAAPGAKAYVPAPAYYTSGASLETLPLAPPPAAGSAADGEDIAQVKAWQGKRTPADCARAAAEAKPGYDSFFGRVGPFLQPLPPEVDAFFGHVRGDTFRAVGVWKEKVRRPRPFVRHGALRPCITAPKGDSQSYPSGHAALARVIGLILAEMVPERGPEFLARADEAGLDRVIGGVHHPTDVAAGKALADEVYAVLLQSPTFVAERESVRRFIKR